MGRGDFAIILAGIAFASSLSAQAYTPTLTPNGVPVRWKDSVKFQVAGNPINRVGISETEFYTAVVHGLQRWNSASSGFVGFDYWQGTDPVVYEANSEFNGLSSIYFASNAKGGAALSSNVLGLTQVWYDTNTGQILETDIVLNDKDFRFTVNEQDTSGYGSGNIPTFGSRNKVFIENVITHELGHALGLSHSGGLQSTMLFMESPEQAHLGCDDQIAIHALYPSGDANERGGISGVVRTEANAAVFGAHVLAISRERGTVLATAMSNKDGHYQISALEPGAYYLMVEPFFAGASPLPMYYSDINTTVCQGGKVFGRSMLTDSSGYQLQAISVSPHRTSDAPALVTRCSGTSGASISAIASLSSVTGPPVLYDGREQIGGFGVTDKLSASSTERYALRRLSGTVEIHALAYSLYSPVHPTLQLYDSLGNPVDAQVFDRAYESGSGYVNYDSYLRAQSLPPGDYSLRVSSNTLDASLYPAGPVSLDSQPFVVITGTIGEGAPPLSAAIPSNVRCRANENFAAYTSPPGPPPRHSTAIEGGSGGIAFCGTVVKRGDSGGGGSSNGPTAGAIAGWLLPWFLMAALAQIMAWQVRRSRRRREQLLLMG